MQFPLKEASPNKIGVAEEASELVSVEKLPRGVICALLFKFP